MPKKTSLQIKNKSQLYIYITVHKHIWLFDSLFSSHSRVLRLPSPRRPRLHRHRGRISILEWGSQVQLHSHVRMWTPCITCERVGRWRHRRGQLHVPVGQDVDAANGGCAVQTWGFFLSTVFALLFNYKFFYIFSFTQWRFFTILRLSIYEDSVSTERTLYFPSPRSTSTYPEYPRI